MYVIHDKICIQDTRLHGAGYNNIKILMNYMVLIVNNILSVGRADAAQKDLFRVGNVV